jgi:UDP-N-acetylmuramate dehydrogenase
MMQFQENVSLKDYSNFKIGGPARYFCTPRDVAEVREAIHKAQELHLPVFILGGGTNLLISDYGFSGMVIKPEIRSHDLIDQNILECGAGVPMSDLLHYAEEGSLAGLEWAGGLPGSVGGAVRGNAGAFGAETKDSVVQVASLSINEADNLRLTVRSREECEFGYRSSIFKKLGTAIILSARFQLRSGDKEAIRAATEEKINFRIEKHPLEYPNIGSIFKNIPLEYFSRNYATRTQSSSDEKSIEAEIRGKFPVKDDPFSVVPTAYLISEAGLKGLSHGGAQISDKHPNFIVNRGGATSADVEFLVGVIKKTVFEKFGVTLEEEVQRVG